MTVFAEAYSVVDNVTGLVSSRIADAVSFSQQLTLQAVATLGALANQNFDVGSGVPSTPLLDTTLELTLDLPNIKPTSFGNIQAGDYTYPTLATIPELSTVYIPEFAASICSLSIPAPPAFTNPGAPPTRPELDDVILPDAPVVTLPTLPVLEELSIPDFVFPTLPTFDALAPEFEGSALPTLLQWNEPTYAVVILDEVAEKIRQLWAGGLGIPAAVEAAMYERAASREEMVVARAVDEVVEEFSARGFTMPSGVQAAREDAVRQDGLIKKLGLNREITIKLAEWQIENVRFGVTNAIAAENVFVNIFQNATARLFEAAKFQVESQITIYNAQVALFNARQNAFEVNAKVFDIRVRAALAELDIFKAQVEAEIARGQLNEQRVRVYQAQIQAVQVAVDVYKAQMEGAQVQSDVLRNRIEAYKADVQAYAERINADRVRFEAYRAQVDAEAAKAGIIDSEARAYAALIQGKAAQIDLEAKRADVLIATNQQKIASFTAVLEADRNRIQAQLGTIQAGAQAYAADTQRFAAVAQAEGTKAQFQLAAKETELRTNIALFQTTSDVALKQSGILLQKAGLISNALQSAGQIGATLAAGATAGVHVGATLSGGGSVTASGSGSSSISASTSESINKNYNYEGT